MTEYIPDTEDIRQRYSDDPVAEFYDLNLRYFDRWLKAERARIWDEGFSSGLDNGLDIADLVFGGKGRLDLSRVPPPRDNPYKDAE